MTTAQRKMLNAVCGDLARDLTWHGVDLDKDDWRELLTGTQLGWRAVPAIDVGDGRGRSLVMLSGSSTQLSRTQARNAINQGLAIGDRPRSQGIDAQPVRWSDTVLLGLGFNPKDLAA